MTEPWADVADRVCVYAVVSGASGPVRAAGVTGERLRRIRVAGLDLVIGTVTRVPEPTTAALRRYDAAVRGIMLTHGSVLPARFGTCSADLDELLTTVRDRRDTLRRALALVRHRVQMTVRVFRPDVRGRVAGPSVARAMAKSDANGAGGGREYLQRRAVELQVPGTEPLRAAVRKWVRAEHTERYDRGQIAGSLYHLVPRGSVASYRRALERAALEADLTIVISGPWPPFAFAGGGFQA